VFRVGVQPDVYAAHETQLRHHVEQSSRSTDALLWLPDQRLAILAPEEMRGQRRLVRRVGELIETFLDRQIGPDGDRVEVRSAAYPRDVHDVESLLERCVPDAVDGD